ncbi:kelch repeat-containing protein [Podospora didyma]|uniref:Kelch repeat-containing protein n=1 Tax=Podospora didyma TaxID=330526 RepID=A0AAE0K0W0_9PEZI|nr:kelch repeat-containing protein [Podospora didyma]
MYTARILTAALATMQGVHAQSWTNLTTLPGTLQEHITIRLSHTKIATLGGLVKNGSTTNQVLIYDLTTSLWKQAAPMPVALNHPNALIHDGRVYVLGGLSGAKGWPPSLNSSVYDPHHDTWTALAPVPAAIAKGSAASAVNNGTIYLAGGILNVYGDTVNTVTAYHIPSNKWIEVPPAAAHLPGGRDHMGYAQIGTKWYVVGGRENGATSTKDTVFILDLLDISAGWKTGAGKMPTPRGGISAAAVGTNIFTFGGEGNTASPQGVFNNTEVYDVVSDTWATLPPMDVPRHGTSAVSIGGKVYIPGGAILQGEGGVDVFTVFTP